jgi:hypothetical protein
MGDKRSGVDEGRKGTVEDIKGKAKKTVGPMTTALTPAAYVCAGWEYRIRFADVQRADGVRTPESRKGPRWSTNAAV